MVKMDLNNVRDPEQLNRMKELKKRNGCHFCGEDFVKTHTSPIIYKNKGWFITANDFPYKGSAHHYLIVSIKHITEIGKISPKLQIELFKAISWLKKHLKSKGESVFVRSGDMSYTGATLDHIHFHFLVGNKKSKNTEWLMVTLGYKKK